MISVLYKIQKISLEISNKFSIKIYEKFLWSENWYNNRKTYLDCSIASVWSRHIVNSYLGSTKTVTSCFQMNSLVVMVSFIPNNTKWSIGIIKLRALLQKEDLNVL